MTIQVTLNFDNQDEMMAFFGGKAPAKRAPATRAKKGAKTAPAETVAQAPASTAPANTTSAAPAAPAAPAINREAILDGMKTLMKRLIEGLPGEKDPAGPLCQAVANQLGLPKGKWGELPDDRLLECSRVFTEMVEKRLQEANQAAANPSGNPNHYI